ncbi:hypothetical protein UQ96_12945, partial [Shigella boydii]
MAMNGVGCRASARI